MPRRTEGLDAVNAEKYHAGLLRQTVTVQYRKLTADGGGGYATEWLDLAVNVRAGIFPLRGTEGLHAMRLDHPVTHRIVLRHFEIGAIPTTDMRVRWADRVFNVRSVIDVGERGRWLELLAEEGVAS